MRRAHWFLGSAAWLIAGSAASDPGRPAELDRAAIAGAIFERSDMVRSEEGGNVTLDVTSMTSSDGRFSSGMYRSGRVRFDIDEPYGVDEFMYFLEGSVTLTSADGTVQVIQAGEAVTIPREWTGVWETDGYTKIWVIYESEAGGESAASGEADGSGS